MKRKYLLFGVWLTITLLIVSAVAPGSLLEENLRIYYYGGLLAGACITLIVALLAGEISRT